MAKKHAMYLGCKSKDRKTEQKTRKIIMLSGNSERAGKIRKPYKKAETRKTVKKFG
jgi:hypothetical protein